MGRPKFLEPGISGSSSLWSKIFVLYFLFFFQNWGLRNSKSFIWIACPGDFMYTIVPEFEVSMANRNRSSIKPEAAGRGFYARFLFAIETENEGTIVLSIFSTILAKTSPKRLLFCEERQKLYRLVAGHCVCTECVNTLVLFSRFWSSSCSSDG